ncbi:hypothetical protein L3N51_01236 [Metallosphaera sp. J1]|uniref:hypothetical protein n=1 Tax=Metallosphaera TaxID=41980 RepID=UPI001EDDFD97|nr:hypothetical protein [Metallosphaera javensis (ex Hofmann et al. 2022)]MCG3108946.1 hypothetical protein [Metallosphaera javensis (ex Hofmann et al. 2022)]BCS92300.1 MAG: hypothetical protein MjAS7_0908 [Metallosphaera javensis (ex Sakai et al. 2022)]
MIVMALTGVGPKSRLTTNLAIVETLFMTGAFIAGVAALLYDKFPIEASWQSFILSAHISFAMLTAFFGLALYTATARESRRGLRILGLLNAVFIAIAAAGGLLFYSTIDYSFSYVMALAFVGAYICSTACIFY